MKDPDKLIDMLECPQHHAETVFQISQMAVKRIKDLEARLAEPVNRLVWCGVPVPEMLKNDAAAKSSCIEAYTQFGVYYIRADTGGFTTLLNPKFSDMTIYVDSKQTLEEAKAAAESHYRENVMNCLKGGM